MLHLTLATLSLQLPANAPSSSSSSSAPLASAVSRRAALTQAAVATTAALTLSPLAAVADVRGANMDMPKNEKDVNKLLGTYGFSPMKVPGGFSPLVEYIGTAPPANIDGSKTKDRAFSNTLLVRFLYPSGWLVETPSIDENGEAGNIGANNYIKGDSANFAAVKLPEGEKLTSLPKDFWKGWLSSQMSKDVYEDVKVKKLKPVTQPDGTEMLIIDFAYTLLTRAGFTVLRQGVASAVIASDSVVGIVTATTSLRYKEMADSLFTCADSFRAYQVKAPAFTGSLI